MHRKLKSDRVIKIFIGEETAPVHIPESLLTHTSDYFIAALRHEVEYGILRFPEDSLRAWKVLLSWMFDGNIPVIPCTDTNCTCFLLVQCWCLGDKYQMPLFQDHVMLAFVNHWSCGCDAFGQAVREAYENTRSGSKLRKFVTECVVAGSIDLEFSVGGDLDEFDGLAGFTRASMEALNLRLTKGKEWFYSSDRWDEYLLRGGPRIQFVPA